MIMLNGDAERLDLQVLQGIRITPPVECMAYRGTWLQRGAFRVVSDAERKRRGYRRVIIGQRH